MLNDATCFKKIFIVTGYTDLRSGIDRLADTIRSYLGEDAIEADTLYLFCGRRTDRIKGLVWENDGYLLLYKRLEASVSVAKDRIRSSFYYRAAVSLAYGRTHDSSQKAGETIEKSTGLYFVTFMHNVEISDCFPSGKRSLPFLFFFVFWKPGLFCTKKQMMFF